MVNERKATPCHLVNIEKERGGVTCESNVFFVETEVCLIIFVGFRGPKGAMALGPALLVAEKISAPGPAVPKTATAHVSPKCLH